MHHFSYRDGSLFAEDVDLRRIADEVGTPVYVYSSATIERHYRLYAQAMQSAAPAGKAHVFYAMKANGNLGVLKTLASLGAGADTVSEGEIRKALAAGFPANRIVFSGVGKSESELRFAVQAGIYQVNIETEGELDLLSRVASALGKRQEAVFRVNPDIGAGGHAKITTGSSENKFGVSFEEVGRLYARAANLPGVRMMGLALHIGSQIQETESFEAAYAKMAVLVGDLRGEGHRVDRLDLGGGLGIPYDIPQDLEGRDFDHGPGLIEAYAAMVKRVTQGLDVELGFEPGRLIVGNAGILMTRVLHLNPRPTKQFLVVDAAMNDLVRPAMYEAYHEIWPVAEPQAGTPEVAYDVVGPICESGDTFTTGRVLPALAPDDLIAFMTAGAYGASMSSTYNQRLLVAEVLVKGADYAVTRPRQTFEELLGTDRAPPWLA
ncbi:diaminopimelate decarboxylase [Bosea sp. (in: a-proteobacteria)]|uniref:diaminopimelate decarboxylase n=1 Tax=Bosea sp. (in: a-proteobacteria) TaxID=1871050 RepID=UPI0027354B36|nr:diaminopimelate decarboxylase [Bosea sp. (in: a-proteobacteria)]MDP3407873.1 diaminopimelate decarboxylase [Bosea sp. (in: a-proteobacteria)]